MLPQQFTMAFPDLILIGRFNVRLSQSFHGTENEGPGKSPELGNELALTRLPSPHGQTCMPWVCHNIFVYGPGF